MPYTITHIATTGDNAWSRVQTFGNRQLHADRVTADLTMEKYHPDAFDVPPEVSRLDDFERMTMRVDAVPADGGTICPDGTVLGGGRINWTVGPGRMLVADDTNVATLTRSAAGPCPVGADKLVKIIARLLNG